MAAGHHHHTSSSTTTNHHASQNHNEPRSHPTSPAEDSQLTMAMANHNHHRPPDVPSLRGNDVSLTSGAPPLATTATPSLMAAVAAAETARSLSFNTADAAHSPYLTTVPPSPAPSNRHPQQQQQHSWPGNRRRVSATGGSTTTASSSRRRSHRRKSRNGSSSSSGSSSRGRGPRYLQFLQREVWSVTAWACVVPLVALVVQRFVERAHHSDEWWHNGDPRYALALLARIVLYALVPHRYNDDGDRGIVVACGFVSAPVWWLYQGQLWTGVLPHWSVRLCEWRLGRLSTKYVGLVLLVHFVTPLVVWGLIQCIQEGLWWWQQQQQEQPWSGGDNPESSAACPPHPVTPASWVSFLDLDYTEVWSHPDHPYHETWRWLLWNGLQEMIVNALFPVAILVTPVLLHLNQWSWWWTLVIVYPLYQWTVDTGGSHATSTLHPSLLLAHYLLRQRRPFSAFSSWFSPETLETASSTMNGTLVCPNPVIPRWMLDWPSTPWNDTLTTSGGGTVPPPLYGSLWRILPQVAGGLLGGWIMQTVFPDDHPKQQAIL